MNMSTGKLNLKGEHLTVLPFQTIPSMNIKRNASGQIVEMTGFAMEAFNWIVKSMDLTFTLIQDEVLHFQDEEINGVRRMGTLSYLAGMKADVAVGGMVMSASVNRIVDVVRLHSSTLACMIPLPKSTTDFGATVLPFNYLVWAILMVFVVAVVGLVYSFSRIESKILDPETHNKKMSDLYNAMDYTFRTLISAGPSSSGRMVAFRILVGTWALGSFLLVNYYNSILTSFFTAPNYQPLINSAYELPKNPDIKITANAISAPVFFFREAEQGIGKYIKDVWKSNPDLLCKNTSQCLEQVLEGSSIYTEVQPAILALIGRDVEKLGRCRFTVAKETYHTFHSGYQLTKGSPFTKMFNQEILKADAFGLTDYWKKSKLATTAARCIGNNKNEGTDDGTPLTMKNLSSAFILLPVGCFFSIIIFLIEKFLGK